MTLLEVADLRTHFPTADGTVRAIDGIDFTVDRGEIVCLVGETGAGKSALCESLTRLVPAVDVDGEVRFDGLDLLAMPDRAIRGIRGDRIAHVFQQPGSSLDPVYRIGDQIVEAMRIHRTVPRVDARHRAVELLHRVGFPSPAARLDDYPHQLSGGMRQRAALAIALAADPDLLVADEPTTALDVTTQASVLELFRELVAERDLAVLLVTHDLGVVAELADRVLVLYAGTVMERGAVEAVFERPAHPYTRLLFRSLHGRSEAGIGAGIAPDGCRFRLECPHAIDECAEVRPPSHAVGSRQEVACVYYGPDRDPGRLEEPPT